MTVPATEPVAVFHTVLVANRGEIARRVIRTLRLLGIRSVAVYSDADAGAPHVSEADEAVRIGAAPAAQSYLDIDAVIAAARRTGAQAIHPGYGFLSENAAFGSACAAAGVVFVGPGERALQVMGDKIRARDHVAASGVPIVPGFSAAGLDDAEIASAAAEAGFPLLIKPSAGGGGKGMQEVHGQAELADAVAAARRIAAAAFGDDTLLFERLIQNPRHIEVQVLADTHGRVIHLGERECTLQRRHQKVVEESPSPLIDQATRARLGAAACAAAASVDYAGAGTVEFIVSADRPDEFFFMEMNTRLQVEHPVTELVTGVDLVAEQLAIAAGGPLALAQADVHLHGHAVEARVYAERPANGFLPATGTVLRWRAPAGARCDGAVETGSAVTTDYDPMIAKVIAHAADRDTALRTLDDALADTVLLGVDSNLAFLRSLIADPAVQAGRMDTGLIDRLPPFVDPEPSAAAFAAAVRLCPAADAVSAEASPLWRTGAGWRMAAAPVPTPREFQLADGTGRTAASAVVPTGDTVAAMAADGTIWVHADGFITRLRPLTRRQAADLRLAQRERAAGVADPELRAPMPGVVVAVHVADGAAVGAGERILTIEAMKMEHPVVAEHDGVVALSAALGDQVSRDQLLAFVTAHPA